MKKIALLCVAVLVLAVAPACKKTEPLPAPPPPAAPGGMPPGMDMPGGGGGMPPGMPGGMGGAPPVNRAVVVPDAVKGKFKAVKIEITNKEKKSSKIETIGINSEFKIPDSKLTMKVGEFLPHFTMSPDSFTSASDKLENPAVQIEIFEDGKSVFRNWLYARPELRSAHPFQNDKFEFVFIEPVKK